MGILACYPPYYNATTELCLPPISPQIVPPDTSRLRVVKSYQETTQRPRCCSKLKQQLYIQNGTRAHYLNYLQRGRVRWGKKRRQSDWLANQMDRKVIDRQVIDRQVEDRQTGRNKADERWYPSRSYSDL
jgi:hypothetical protein